MKYAIQKVWGEHMLLLLLLSNYNSYVVSVWKVFLPVFWNKKVIHLMKKKMLHFAIIQGILHFSPPLIHSQRKCLQFIPSSILLLVWLIFYNNCLHLAWSAPFLTPYKTWGTSHFARYFWNLLSKNLIKNPWDYLTF